MTPYGQETHNHSHCSYVLKHLHLEERNQLNWNNMSNILVALGVALLFVSVFLIFREFAWTRIAEQHLIPAILATFVLAIIFFGASAVTKGIKKE